MAVLFGMVAIAAGFVVGVGFALKYVFGPVLVGIVAHLFGG